MAQVAAAGRAGRLRSGHEPGSVGLGGDGCWVDRGEEARPTRAGLELRLGPEELGAAAGATIRPGAMLVPEVAGEGPLGALLAKDAVALRRELGAPVGVALLDGGRGGSSIGHRGVLRPRGHGPRLATILSGSCDVRRSTDRSVPTAVGVQWDEPTTSAPGGATHADQEPRRPVPPGP